MFNMVFSKESNLIIVFTSDDQRLHYKDVFRDLKEFAKFMLSVAKKDTMRIDSIVYLYDDECTLR